VFGSIVSVAQDAQGNRAIRRGEVFQEPFSKYAYFSTIEAPIVFASGDNIFGPVFSDDQITIFSTGATFWGPVKSAQTINGKSFGTFKQGFTENVPIIPMPTTADLAKLKNQALYGNTEINGTTLGGPGQATTRIEFVALDLNGDGNTTDDDEGFMKVYQVPAAEASWLMADTTAAYKLTPDSNNLNGVRNSQNCGHTYDSAGTNHPPIGGVSQGFMTFARHPTTWTVGKDSKANAPAHGKPSEISCYLGGSDSLNLPKVFNALTDGHGQWQPWPGAVDPRVTANAPPGEAPYLWPISRALNPNFRGVVYVEGKVAVSGKVRGHLTLAASGRILIADDLTYVTNPGAANCADMLGMFSGDSILVAENLLNDPIPYYPGTSTATSWNATSDMFIDGFVLTLASFSAENYKLGPNSGELCGGVNTARGCLFLTGGLIQTKRGAVGLVTGQGYIKRYAYDACGVTDPPPYFPTTGHFSRGHYFEVEPTNFNINTYWSLLIPN
jgi:hypothetical protein